MPKYTKRKYSSLFLQMAVKKIIENIFLTHQHTFYCSASAPNTLDHKKARLRTICIEAYVKAFVACQKRTRHGIHVTLYRRIHVLHFIYGVEIFIHRYTLDVSPLLSAIWNVFFFFVHSYLLFIIRYFFTFII